MRELENAACGATTLLALPLKPYFDLANIVMVFLLAVVVAGALLSFVERRLLGWWQDRYGPNRVGPFGMFQIAADMLKMFFKEDSLPGHVNKFYFLLAPVVGGWRSIAASRTR